MNSIVTVVIAATITALLGASTIAAELPYSGHGDPLHLTGTARTARVTVPYTGNGDPLGLVSRKTPTPGTEVPYTGHGDPLGLTGAGRGSRGPVVPTPASAIQRISSSRSHRQPPHILPAPAPSGVAQGAAAETTAGAGDPTPRPCRHGSIVEVG